MRYTVRYTIPVEVTVRVDVDDEERAELLADQLVRQQLSALNTDDERVAFGPILDLPDPDETIEGDET